MRRSRQKPADKQEKIYLSLCNTLQTEAAIREDSNLMAEEFFRCELENILAV